MGGIYVVPRDNSATEAISAWRNAEERTAQRLLQEKSWLAQQALLRGDIDRYTGLTGITPQVYNPNYNPNLKSALLQQKEALENTPDAMFVKPKKESDLASVGGMRSGFGKDMKRVEDGRTKNISAYENTDMASAIEAKISKEKELQRFDKYAQMRMRDNPEFYKGREFGKNYTKLLRGYWNDKASNKFSDEQLLQKYGPLIQSAAVSWARNGNYMGLFAPTKQNNSGSGKTQDFTFRIPGEKEARTITAWPGASIEDIAQQAIRRYPDLRGHDVKKLSTRITSLTHGPIVQDTQRIAANEALGGDTVEQGTAKADYLGLTPEADDLTRMLTEEMFKTEGKKGIVLK